MGTDYLGCTRGFYMRINRLDSLHVCVVVLVNAKLKEYSDWLGDNTTVPSAAGWVKPDLFCRS